jgi:hypothetical protein
LATYTYNGKKSFAGEYFDSLAAFYRKRWLLRYFVRRQVTRSYKRSCPLALFLAGFALFVRVKSGFADHL